LLQRRFLTVIAAAQKRRLRGRADALAQRAAGLKKLADAWLPLYQSLNPDQKQRMQVLAVRVLRQLKDAVDTRRMAMYDEEDDED